MRVRPAESHALAAAETNPVCCGVSVALQESGELCAQWDRRQSLGSLYREWQEQAEAEWAAWEAWCTGEAPEPAQVPAPLDTLRNDGRPLRHGAEGGRSSGLGGSVAAQSVGHFATAAQLITTHGLRTPTQLVLDYNCISLPCPALSV